MKETTLDVQKVAKLARLKLDEGLKKDLEQEFERILQQFKTIESVNTEGVEPLLSPVEEPYELREDQSQLWEEREEALNQAPELSNNQFKVPPVV